MGEGDEAAVERTRAIRRRMEALGYSARRAASQERLPLSDKTIRKALRGIGTDKTYQALESWLDWVEARVGPEEPEGSAEETRAKWRHKTLLYGDVIMASLDALPEDEAEELFLEFMRVIVARRQPDVRQVASADLART